MTIIDLLRFSKKKGNTICHFIFILLLICHKMQGNEFERLRDLLLGIEVDKFPDTLSQN